MLHISTAPMFASLNRRNIVNSLRFYTKYAKNDQILLHNNGAGLVASLSKNPHALPLGASPNKEIHPETFEPNKRFFDRLFHEMRMNIQNDFTFIIEAGTSPDTHMPIYDLRKIPNFSRTPEVDDIFGYVFVDKDSKINEGTFEHNEFYRVCNGSGLPKLSDYMYERMKAAVEKETEL